MASKPRFFISYRRSDKTIADYLHRELRQRGCHVFYDQDVRANDPVPLTMHQAIQRAQHFILVLSADTLDSAIIRREIDVARKFRKQFIVVIAPEIATRQDTFQATLSNILKGLPYISLSSYESEPERSLKEILNLTQENPIAQVRKILSRLFRRNLKVKTRPSPRT